MMWIKKSVQIIILVAVGLVLLSGSARAWPEYKQYWQNEYSSSTSLSVYGSTSPLVSVGCQLCHGHDGTSNSGSTGWVSTQWNAYGDAIQAVVGRNVDEVSETTFRNALRAVQGNLSVSTSGLFTYLAEINGGAQPGWKSANNSIYDRNGNVALSTLGPPSGISPLDPSSVGTLQFSSATYSVNEGAGNAIITITRTGGSSGAVGVTMQTSNGTATAGSDYSTVAQTVTFANGDTANKTVNIPIINDIIFEGNETVNVNLVSPTGGATLGSPSSAVLTIVDNDPPPAAGALQFTSSTYSANENAGAATITITRIGGSSGAVGVTLQSSNGTATAGSDYTAITQTVTFANGDTANKTVNIPIINDSAVEGNETINLSLVSVTGGAALGSPSSATLTIIDDDFPAVSNLANISTRGRVLTGDNVMIGGFIIEGSAPSRVLVRSRGPSLGGQPFNLPGTLANPLLQIFSGNTVIAQNDNWQDPPNCPGFVCEGAGAISTTGLDPCTPNPGQTAPPPNCALESVILITLPPGGYTAFVTGADGGTGIGMVEVFEEDNDPASGLTNISTRGFVQTGDNVMIGGLIIEGTAPATVLVRARGPSMSGAPFFVPGTLADPFLQLFSGTTVIAQNNNWQDAPSCAAGLTCGDATQISASGLAPCDPNPGQSTSPPGCTQEAAVLITLPPGAYTAMLSGVGGGTGVGLIEVFDIH